MRKITVFTIVPLLVLLSSCQTSFPPVVNQSSTATNPTNLNSGPSHPSGATNGVVQVTTPKVTIEKRWLGAGTDLFVNIGDRGSEPLKQVFTYNPLPRSDFSQLNIPANASSAGLAKDYDASEEDLEVLYAIVEGSEVVIYSGYQLPGRTEETSYKKIKSYPL